jgi:outer membrane protein TolC
LEIGLRQATNRLCLLLGMPPQLLNDRLGTMPIPTAPLAVATGIPADLLRRRPDVLAAERQAAAQCARIGIAEADFYPAVAITGDFGWQSKDISTLLSSGSFAGSVGPSFQWALLNYGRILNNVRFQDARFQEAVIKYQNTVLKAGNEVEDGLVTFLKSQQQAKSLAESVKAAEEAVRVALAQYKSGLVDFNRVALLEQNLVGQQNQLAQAQAQIALGLIQVYRALGGGWEIRLADCNTNDLPPPPVPELIPEVPEAQLGMPAQR